MSHHAWPMFFVFFLNLVNLGDLLSVSVLSVSLFITQLHIITLNECTLVHLTICLLMYI
jgi:hypothetical protein